MLLNTLLIKHQVNVLETALHLRSLILEVRNTCNDFPFHVTADILAKGQVETPDTLLNFFQGALHWLSC